MKRSQSLHDPAATVFSPPTRITPSYVTPSVTAPAGGAGDRTGHGRDGTGFSQSDITRFSVKVGLVCLANRGTYSGWIMRDGAWPALSDAVLEDRA